MCEQCDTTRAVIEARLADVDDRINAGVIAYRDVYGDAAAFAVVRTLIAAYVLRDEITDSLPADAFADDAPVPPQMIVLAATIENCHMALGLKL